MLTIEKDRLGNGYIVRIGDGKKGGYRAKNRVELFAAIEHYFRMGSGANFGEPRDYCPLCGGKEHRHES